MNHKCKVYRTVPTQEDDFQIDVKIPTGMDFRGEVLDINMEGVGALFPREEVPPLAVGHVVTLQFTSPRLANPLEVEAWVRSRSDTTASRRYGLEYKDRDALKRQLSSGLYKLFNQRRSYRVKPTPDKPVKANLEVSGQVSLDQPLGVILESNAHQASGWVVDLSAHGAGVRIEEEAETGLAAADLVDVSLALPPNQRVVKLAAWIRNRRAQDRALVYGLEFVVGEQQDIVDYVMRRQKEDLQVRVR